MRDAEVEDCHEIGYERKYRNLHTKYFDLVQT